MTERPILFNAAMVRAILSGQKTQTRRTVKSDWIQSDSAPLETHPGVFHFWCSGEHACPFGVVGDRLWVREAFADLTKTHGQPWEQFNETTCRYERGKKPFIWYRADGDQPDVGDGSINPQSWKPSIHMPRWASRITLEITGVRVERLHDISRGDAMAEGCPFPNMAKGSDPREWFAEVWNSTGGDWDANPWVWVIEFKRIATPEKN